VRKEDFNELQHYNWKSAVSIKHVLSKLCLGLRYHNVFTQQVLGRTSAFVSQSHDTTSPGRQPTRWLRGYNGAFSLLLRCFFDYCDSAITVYPFQFPSMANEETMRAWTHSRADLPSRVLTQSILPKPKVTFPTQVLVKISHCALNPGASIVMQLLPFVFRASPAIPEMDFSGTVVEAGTGVPSARFIKAGTDVFGSIPLAQIVKTTSGALAEYVVVDHTVIVAKPSSISASEAAGLGIAGATALQLIKSAKLKSGDSVLVNGSGGGIGHLILQMCCERIGPSGKVVAICSKRNMDWIHALGADRMHLDEHADVTSTQTSHFQIIDREAHPLVTFLTDTFSDTRFDVVIDAVGIQEIYNASPAFLKEGKPYVTVGPRAGSYTYLGMLSTLGTMS
jgi:NADPH:quinone reductase-like Zn-dependent oxidoreductase